MNDIKTLNLKDNLIFKKITFLFLGLFFLSTVLHTPSYIKYFLYFLTIVSLATLVGLRKAIYDGFKDYYPYLIFVLICTLSYTLLEKELFNVTESPQIENVIALFVLFIFLSQLSSYYEDIMKTMIGITAAYLFISLPAHFFYHQHSFLTATLFLWDIEVDSYSLKNTLGILIVILCPYTIYKFSRTMSAYYFFILCIFGVSIFYTFSRASLILFILSFLFLFMSKDAKVIKANFLFIVVIISVALMFQITPKKYNDLKHSSNIIILNDQTLDIIDVNKSFTKESSRFDYISKSVDGFLEKPLFGNGFSSFRTNHSYFDEQNRLIRKPVTHNDFAQVLYEMGLLGFSSFLYLFLFNINRYRYYGKDNFLSTIMLSQLILLGVSLNIINLTDHAIFWIVMALTLIKNTNQKSPSF